MTLRHLQIFIKVYETQSITRAAEELNIAQPSISFAIKEMETYYSVQFFDRMNRRIFANSNADKFYEYAIHIMSLFLEMEKGIQNWSEEGVMRIGSSITISNAVLPQIIQDFKKQYPHLQIQLFVNNAKTIEKNIIENKIDIALIETNLQNENIIQQPFMSDHLTTIVSCHHPLLKEEIISLDKLLEYPILMREQGSSVANLMKSLFTAHQHTVEFAMESASTQAIIKCVEANLGISVLPYMLVKQAIEENKVKEIFVSELDIQRKYYIVHHKHKYISPISQDFFETCLNFEKQHKYK